MNNTQSKALELVVGIIKDTIGDIKIEQTSASSVTLKDGNATIQLTQQAGENADKETVVILDPKDIIYSEDLLPELNDLTSVTVIINGLDIETHLVFQAVRDCFDQISNSYEFLKIFEKDVIRIKSGFKFGSHAFVLNVLNEKDQIAISTEFAASFDAAVRKTVETDVIKVQKAINKMVKEDGAF
ncbi:hypothetical protein IM793_18510 [Pedobacter sp. MR2016-19]|uniref:hypothetical protein n=1 Tax=Pedobacter sp. MR2016-19 TaxID=2780089 RepID=UPI001873745D|nr:hypothetical protein [Pedobacter sp. MR2016-19]MBE5321162.1 hypothetical protein [Pedobacter sp. MR2016-19]